MGSMSSENKAYAKYHIKRVRELLEEAGYSDVRVETLDLGNRIAIVWNLHKPWPEIKP